MAQTDVDDTGTTGEGPPQYIPLTLSSLCSILPRPLILTGAFREILVNHFATASHIETPELRQLIWRNGEQTGILIESIHRWRPETTEKRPAIIIKRNAYQVLREGIGDLLQMPIADREGNPHYSSFMRGSHTLFCVGGTGAQAELLAAEVYRETHHFAPVLRRVLHLKQLRAVEVGAVQELEEATETFVVPVTVAYAYEDNWVIRKETQLLRSLRMSYVLDG